MHCEEIARELADSFGVASPGTYRDNFARAVTRISTGPVVILANTQWAGRLRTTHEPERVLSEVVRTLIRNHPRSVRMRLLVEVEDTAGPLASMRGRALTLRDPDEPTEHPRTVVDEWEEAALRALALAEARRVPLAVWSLLCSVLGQDISVRQLAHLASSPSAGPVYLSLDEATWQTVSFRREFVARAWRDTVPPETAERFHAQALSALRSAEPTPEIDWYVHRAASGHAVAAGRFESLLHDAALMAKVGHKSLFEGFETAYHDRPVPPTGLAAHLHYLSERGVWPSSHGEWLALLHHSLLDRGPSGQALADRLLASADNSALPWHTVWAHGIGPGTGTTERLVERPNVRDLRVMRADSGLLAIATDTRGNRNVRHLDSGTPAPDPDDTTADPDSVATDQGLHGWRPAGATSGYVDMPRMPRHVRYAARLGDRALMSSTDGVFAIAIHASASEAPSGVLKTMVRTTTRLGTADLPAEALDASAKWFENVWGVTTLKRVDATALPSDLVDADARRFLTEIGFPHLSGFLELETLDLSETGLTSVPGATDGDGPWFLLGDWQGARLVLDGTSGKVLQDGSSGLEDPLAGSSLRQFVTMARLYYWWYASDWPIEDTEADLHSWLDEIDAAAFATECWQRVFEDYNFTDRI
ncbi:SUKH-4 family immunity protein [Streptomyces sp. NPDC058954]|uniref:SUKH-4 family immunity protein n=1 Tax=Streptomyces sp. NPDC058954 TaxID=3346677 RepID=UPI0036BA78FE